jgi:alkylated DNA repair dioxygenase AlkB
MKMADAGEGLIDAQNRIQERMDEREEERARRARRQVDSDPEQVRRTESLRLAYTELSRQLQATTHTARRQQLTSALAELERQLQALGAPTH